MDSNSTTQTNSSTFVPSKITEELYKKNSELAVRNKTLALLGKLYEISILTLEPKPLAEKIATVIQVELGLDLVGLFFYNNSEDALEPLFISTSDRLGYILAKYPNTFLTSGIATPSQNELLKSVIHGVGSAHSEDIGVIFNGKLFPPEVIQEISEEAHVKSILLYKLNMDKSSPCILTIGLNRTYEQLSTFEQESIRSLVNVVATALDKSFLYKELENTNFKLAKVNAKLEDLNRQKTEFVSIASHQLRTPLTAIKGYSSMLLEGSFGELSDKSRGAVDVIFQSSLRLVNVIEDFLNITRIELGKMKYDMTVIDIAEMMKALEGELTPSAKRKNLDFSIKLDAPQFHTYADYGKLSQVVSNVIDNAIKYTPEGRVDVRVTRPLSDPKNIHIIVKDTGVGIKAESIPKLFQKFIRADEVGATHISGTGLGLYVAKQIIDAHKGDIRIESDGVGKGSTFTITVPVYEGDVTKK